MPFSVQLQAVDIRQIYDKFPEKKGGLKELYDKGPQPVFFLVKFWVSWINFCIDLLSSRVFISSFQTFIAFAFNAYNTYAATLSHLQSRRI